MGWRISPISDVGALGVIGRGGCWRVATSLFGEVETIVVLVGERGGGLQGAAGENGPAQQREDDAHPSSVEGEAKWHEAVLMVSADGEPDRRHYAAQSNYEYQHSSEDRVLILGALWFIAKADAGHGHEEQPHCRQTQDWTCDHEGTSRLDVGWQVQDLRQVDAVVSSRGDDALRPGPLDPQLIRLHAGVRAVFTRDRPVVGGRRDHDAQPAEAADEEAAQQKTRVGHGAHCA